MIVDFYHNNKRIIIETHWYSSKYHLDQQIVISRRLLTCNNVLDVIQDPDVFIHDWVDVGTQNDPPIDGYI